MPTILISGALANKPFNGGNAWTRLSWALGFRRLGFDVCFIEQIEPGDCVDSSGNVSNFEASVNYAYFRATMERSGLAHSCSLIYDSGKKVDGLSLKELCIRAQNSLLLLNISGHLTVPEVMDRAPCKVYYDDDPGFTQFWHAAGQPGARLAGHDFFFTIGRNIGTTNCIPTDGVTWKHTRPPVVLDEWPYCSARRFERFTTVGSWRGAYGSVQFRGKTYGTKGHEFRKFIRLPLNSGIQFELALQIYPNDKTDLDALLEHGWVIVDPKVITGSPDEFRRYVQNSSAEFSVAQGLYVETNSGWFSDRTVRYLACGKPALVQDTGFTSHYPCGKGLVPFRTLDDAIEGAKRITADYEAQCRAARRLAEEYFDSDLVINDLMSQIGIASQVQPRAQHQEFHSTSRASMSSCPAISGPGVA
jgi:hypothetical protein